MKNYIDRLLHWSLDKVWNVTIPLRIKPRVVAWQSIRQMLRHPFDVVNDELILIYFIFLFRWFHVELILTTGHILWYTVAWDK